VAGSGTWKHEGATRLALGAGRNEGVGVRVPRIAT
jgi:hypothetical protein